MASASAVLQRAIDRYERFRVLVRQLNERQGALAAQQLARFTQELIRLVAARTNATGPAVQTEEQLVALIREMDRAAARFVVDVPNQALYKAAIDDLGEVMLDELPKVYRAFGGTTVGRLREARAAFLTESRQQFPIGFAEWAGRFRDASTGLRSQMQRVLIQGQLEGWGQREIARGFLRIPEFQFRNLPKIGVRGEQIFTMGGTLSPSDALVRRAHVIAKTEMTAVVNKMHRSWTKAAGFDHYINVNDEPVATECIEANDAGVKTWKDWQNWTASNGRGGLPPRHPNCDSLMLAAPPGYTRGG